MQAARRASASSSSRSSARLKGERRAVQRISSTQERPMPVMMCWSRRTPWRGRAPLGGEQLAQPAGGSGQASGPSAERGVVGLDLLGAQHLDPRALARAELAQAQLMRLKVIGDADEQPRRAVAQRRALVVELEAAGRHEVDEERELTGQVDDEVLPAPPERRGSPCRRSRRERRVEGLQRVDAGSEGGSTSSRRAAPRRGDGP